METEENKPLPSTLYTEEYFLTACEGYDVFVESEGRHLSRRLNDAFAVAEVDADMRILDVGCGRGEIIRHCMKLGIEAYGVDYAEVATLMTRDVVAQTLAEAEEKQGQWVARVYRSDAKRLPFPDKCFDRVLMFDVVEHLYPWELHRAMLEVRRVLKDDGRFIIHTAPNRWYDTYAYPVVRFFRRLFRQSGSYPKNPRAIVPVNQDVHVNEQDIRSMNQALKSAGFKGKVWLDTPPQNRQENFIFAALRRLFFEVPPFRWFFEREVFAVATKKN
ncbi:MAG: class I SAM-dependent methyltransferase [Candidatus Promineifilaceae bacterium]